MIDRWTVLVLFAVLVPAAVSGQSPGDAREPWPGLRLRDTLEAVRIIREARVISQQTPSGALKPVFLRRESEIRMRYLRGDETMWFALDLKGTEIDPREWWIEWAGELVNLAALLSYGEEFDPKIQAPVWKKSIF